MAPTTAPDTGISTMLASLRAEVEVREASVIREWATIAAWASENVVEGLAGAATIREGFVDTGLPIAGDGAPLVSEFALMELVAVLGRTPDGGRAYVGRAGRADLRPGRTAVRRGGGIRRPSAVQRLRRQLGPARPPHCRGDHPVRPGAGGG
jgi:hypothetical protein